MGEVEGCSAVYELGFHLLPAFWGRGFATEAGAAVLDFAFQQLRIDAVFAGHNPANLASSKVLQKLGFTHLRDEYYQPTGLMHPSYLCTVHSWRQRRYDMNGTLD